MAGELFQSEENSSNDRSILGQEESNVNEPNREDAPQYIVKLIS